METSDVKQEVRGFVERTGATGREEHAFTPWYLWFAHNLPIEAAQAQSSDGNFDFGLDGFHLDTKANLLVLIQAKFTESLAQIAKGFSDLARCLESVNRILQRHESEVRTENNVLWRLRAMLNDLPTEQRDQLEINLVLLHLSSDDRVVFENKVHGAQERLKESIPDSLPERVVNIRTVGPLELGPKTVKVVPSARFPLTLHTSTSVDVGEGKMILGVGRLADLVKLYEERRDNLFARNVRYYLRSKKNTEKGPAAKMRSTLRDMCVDGKTEPRRFALFHNGVTIFAKKAERDGETVTMREPYVLNGCQTIKNAFFFRNEPKLKTRIKDELWREVMVPIRIIETNDDELVRTVTVNNNRQNAMTAAALRSNDQVQIRLERRFRERGIFYQRQEGAFDNVWSGASERLEGEFKNTGKTYVDLHDLARSISACLGEVRIADRPNDLFESDSAYGRCFDEDQLRSIALLNLLQNLNDVLGVVLKMDLGLSAKAGGPPPSRFLYQTMCLLVRHLAKTKNRDFVRSWGDRLYGRDQGFREQVRLELGHTRSGIKQALATNFMRLESRDGKEIHAAFESCEKALGLKSNIDPFTVFADIDAEVEAHGSYEEPVEDDEDD